MSKEIDGRELLAIRARAARSQDGQHQSLRQTEADRHALVREVYRLRSERDAGQECITSLQSVLDELTATAAEAASTWASDQAERDALKAAVERARRMAQVWVDIRPTYPTASDAGHGISYAGQQILGILAIPEAPGGES
jgi:hypothetical protein